MKLENIKAIQIFNNLSDPDLQIIDGMIRWIKYPKNFSILRHRELSSDVYFIASGSVKAMAYSCSGKEISYENLPAGQMFGEISAIDRLDRKANVVVLENSLIGSMSSEEFWKLLEKHPAIVKEVLGRLTKMVRLLCGRIYEYAALGVTDRIRVEILKHARQNMSGENRAIITNMPTHEDIANRVSTHREAVTKGFSDLKKEGYIIKDGRKIIVPDVQRLADLINDLRSL